MSLPSPGVIFVMTVDAYLKGSRLLEEPGPDRLQDWPVIGQRINRDGRIILATNSVLHQSELNFSPSDPSESSYSLPRESETGTVVKIIPIEGESTIGFPVCLWPFPIKFRLSTASTRGNKRVWFIGLAE